MLCLLCNTTQAADNNKVLSEKKHCFEFFSKTAIFCHFTNTTRQQSKLLVPKKSMQLTIRRLPVKTLLPDAQSKFWKVNFILRMPKQLETALFNNLSLESQLFT